MKLSPETEKFYKYIGGLSKGDSILFISPDVETTNIALKSILENFLENNYYLIYFSESDLFKISNNYKKNIKILDLKRLNNSDLQKELRKLTHKKNKSIIFFEDLNDLRLLSKNEKQFINNYSNLVLFTKKHNIHLISTISNRKFSSITLGIIKDIPDLALEINIYQGEIYLNLIHSKNRYIPDRLFPLKLKKRAYDIIVNKEEIPDVFFESEFYQKTFRNSHIALLILESNGNFREANKKLLSLIGYNADELKVLNLVDLIIPEKKFSALRKIAQLQYLKDISFDTVIKNKKGKKIQVDIYISKININYFLISVRDITEQMKLLSNLLQQSSRYQYYLENVKAAVGVFIEDNCIYCNKLFSELLKKNSSDIINKIKIKDIFDRSGWKKIKTLINSDLSQINTDIRIKQGTDEYLSCEVWIDKVREHNKNILIVTIYDITKKIELIGLLTKTKENFQTILENTQSAIAVYQNGRYQLCNKAFLQLFNFKSEEQIIGKDKSFIGISKTKIDESQKYKAKDISTKILEIKKEDNSIHIIEIISKPIIYEGELAELEILRDITNESRLQSDLKQKIKEFELLNKIIAETNSQWKINEICSNSIKSILSNFGWKAGAIYLRSGDCFKVANYLGFSDLILEKIKEFDISSGIGGFISKTLESHIFDIKSYPSYLPHKKTFESENFRTIAFIPAINAASVNGMILLASEDEIEKFKSTKEFLNSISIHLGNAINSSQKLEELINIQHKYENLINSTSIIIYHGYINNMYEFTSPGIEQLTGYSQRDFRKNKSLLLSITHPDDRKLILKRNANINQVADVSTIEYRILPRGKAEYIWIQDSIKVFKNEKGELEGIYGTLLDINERKNFENTLRNMEQFKSGILEGIREGVIVLDNEYNFLDWNEAMENITGIPRSEILGRNISEIPVGVLGQNIIYYLDQALRGHVVSSQDIEYNIPETKKSGYLWGKYAPLKNNEGKVTGVVAIISDITTRKKLEEEIRQSEQLLTNVIDTIGDFFVLTDLKGRVLQVNREFVNSLGYSRSDVIGLDFPYPWLIEEEMSKFVIWVSNLRAKSYLHDFDMTWQTKAGKRIDVSLNTTLLRNSYGEPIAMLNLARNISERRKMAKQLEQRNRLIESINSIIQTANQTMEYDVIFKTFLDKIYDIVHFDKIEACLIVGNNIKILGSYNIKDNSYESGKIIPIDSHITKITSKIKKPILVIDSNEDERLIINNVVEEEFGSIVSYPLYAGGDVLGTINIYSRDTNSFGEEVINNLAPFIEQMGAIVDRILLFQKVTDDSVYIHNLLNSIDKIVFTIDKDLRLREINKAWYDFVRKLDLPVKNSYNGNYLLDEVPDYVFNKDIISLIASILTGNIKHVSKELEIAQKNGEKINYLLTINPMIITDNITGAVFTLTDITQIKKTQEELKTRNEQLIDLNDISSQISSSLNIEKLFDLALPKIARLLKADHILVWLQEPKEINSFYLKKFYPDTFKQLERKYFTYQSPEEISDMQYYASEPKEIPEFMKNQIYEIFGNSVSSVASIHIKSADRVNGLLQIFYTEPKIFTAQDEQLLSMIANQLATSFENASLYEALQSQLQRLNLLYELSRQLTATLDIDQMLTIIYEQIFKIVEFDEMLVKFVDESKMLENVVFHMKNISGEIHFIPKRMQASNILVDSITWKIIESKSHYFERKSQEEVVCYFPMESKNKIIGILILKPKPTRTYDETEIIMLENICSLTAIAIEKTKLYEETVQKSIEIQKRNKELDDFTYVVSHDLKEPLISIEGYSQILKEEFSDIFNNIPREYIDSIVQASGRMKKLIDDLLTLSRISRISESFKPVRLDSVIKDVEIDLLYAIQTKKINLIKPDEFPEMFGNETQIRIVFRNLISNAIKFSNKEKPVIEIGCKDYDENFWLLYVKDNGIGIDKEYFDKIFVIFQRLHTREEYEGTGAGLAIVKKIIEIHKGKIWVESTLGEGSTFYFTLPKIKEQS